MSCRVAANQQAQATLTARLTCSVMHQVNVALKLSEDEWGRRSLSADLVFEQPVKVLMCAWLGSEWWWAKSPKWRTHYNWAAQYHHLRDGSRQVIVTCGALLQDCVIPAGFDPEAPGQAEVEFLKPSALYQKESHGLGLIVVPQGAARSLRNVSGG